MELDQHATHKPFTRALEASDLYSFMDTWVTGR